MPVAAKHIVAQANFILHQLSASLSEEDEHE